MTLLGGAIGSTGFWGYIQSRDKRRNAYLQLLLGLAHERIIFQGMSYVDRGWITKDEYEDFIKYLYHPYSECGGNGLAERVMQEISKLPMRGSNHPVIQTFNKENHVQ